MAPRYTLPETLFALFTLLTLHPHYEYYNREDMMMMTMMMMTVMMMRGGGDEGNGTVEP